MTKITFERTISSDPKKVFDVISNFKNYEKLLPNYYPLVRIKSVRDESSLVAEHLRLHDKEFVIMAKHFNDPPYRHEMRVVGGDIKGSYIIEKIIPFESQTKISVEAKIDTGKRFSIIKNTDYEKALEDLYDEVVTVIESR